MQKRLTFLIVVFICSLNAQNLQGDNNSLPQEIIKNYYQSVAKFDFSEMRKFCSEDYKLVESSGVYNLEEYIGFLQPDVGKLKFESLIEIQNSIVEDCVSWVTYIKTAKIHTEKKEILIKTRETAILTNKNNEWKIRLIHSTDIK